MCASRCEENVTRVIKRKREKVRRKRGEESIDEGERQEARKRKKKNEGMYRAAGEHRQRLHPLFSFSFFFIFRS